MVMGASVLALLGLLLPIRTPWQAYQCDVGQGDALLLNLGGGSAIVIDVGPDPALIDRCLRSAGIDSIALLVITHFISEVSPVLFVAGRSRNGGSPPIPQARLPHLSRRWKRRLGFQQTRLEVGCDLP